MSENHPFYGPELAGPPGRTAEEMADPAALAASYRKILEALQDLVLGRSAADRSDWALYREVAGLIRERNQMAALIFQVRTLVAGSAPKTPETALPDGSAS